ncbi:MAG: hypothetical protein ABRQ38_23565 [Candidatus Eremiobacterota bacterium]
MKNGYPQWLYYSYRPSGGSWSEATEFSLFARTIQKKSARDILLSSSLYSPTCFQKSLSISSLTESTEDKTVQ